MKRFPLPDPGEGLTEAEIVTWLVAVGDEVKVNDPIVEVETSKSLVELPSPWDGRVVELLVEVGETVDVGTPIIVIDDGEADEEEAGAGGPGTATAAQAAPAQAAPVPATPAYAAPGLSAPAPAVPGLSAPAPAVPGMSASAPAVPGMSAPAPAVPGLSAPAPAVPGLSAAPATPVAPVEAAPAPRAAAVPAASPAAEPEAPAAATANLVGYGPEAAATVRRPRKPGAAMAKPPVRKYARDRGVRLRDVPGTGPGGTITYADVDAWLAATSRPVEAVARVEPPTPSVAEVAGPEHEYLAGPPKLSYGRVPIRGVRKATALAVTSSLFTAPHVTEWLTCDVSATMDLVERLKSAREFRDARVSPMLMVAKAACLALRTNPELNARWDEDAQEIVYYGDVNLGVAAATPRGLLVPNIKGADQMGLLELAHHFGELTRTAREGRTTPADLRGGTFTITNVGVFGVDAGTPILNNGESGILCLGAISRRPWVVGHGSEERIEPRWVTTLAVSFDHRLVDGEGGSKFLADVARLLADPALALLF